MEYYSVIKKNDTMPFVEMWTDLEIILNPQRKINRRYHLHEEPKIWHA